MKRGFTLIEILVSVAIFTVVMVIALGALLSMSVADRKAESLKSVINNLNFAMDSMSRTIRTGYNYNCNTVAGGDCVGGGSALYFVPASSYVKEAYQLENLDTDPAAATVCHQSGTVGCIVRATFDGSSWSAWSPITSPEVVITCIIPGAVSTCASGLGGPNDTLFYLIGSGVGSADSVQPKVTITISGYVQLTATQFTPFHLQTSVTERVYDQ